MRKEEKDRMGKSWFSVRQMLGILAVLLILSVAIWSYNTYRLKQIHIEGLTRYSEAEFCEKLGNRVWYSVTPFFCLADTLAQKKIPFIEKYEILYQDPQTARIVVHEKRVTGCVIIMGRYMFFDKDGMVVESSSTRVEGVPVVTGLEFNEIVLYQKLQVQKQSLFDTILNLTRLIEHNGIAVQEIAFDTNYEVTLSVGGFSVLLGKKTSYDEALNALSGILDALTSGVLGAVTEQKGTLDMRNYSQENQEVILKQP